MTYDAIVVGGGPGGSTTAWRLAQAGVRTLVLDAAVFPRVKICAGWVDTAALADVEIDPETYPRTIQPFTACRLEFAGARHETRWQRPASYGILRREFDHYLLERGGQDGGRRALRRAGGRGHDDPRGRPRGDGRAAEFEAPVVIGAGGHNCPVARALGRISTHEEVVVAQESETQLTSEQMAGLASFMDAPELYVEPDLRGYGWYFPKRDCGQHRHRLHRRQRRQPCLSAARPCCRRCARPAGCPPTCPIAPFKGTPTSCAARRHAGIIGPRFCLVGDAAGLARDLSGEGIGPAIRERACWPPRPSRLFLRHGAALDGYAREVVRLYGRGAGLAGPAAWPVSRRRPRGRPCALVLGAGLARRRIVFDTIFGMKEAVP